MNWLYESENLLKTPSILDSLDLETEKRYRNEGVEFIRHLCDRLGLRHITMSTACVLFHRFYMLKSFRSFSRWEIAPTCLFLAGKAEETPKKAKDVIKMAKNLLNEIGRVEESSKIDHPRFLAFENILLQTLKFDLYVRQPYSHLLTVAQTIKGDKDIVNDIVQMAWSFLNDSLYIPLCVIYPPELIALACLYLAFTTKVKQLTSVSHETAPVSATGPQNDAILLDKTYPKEWWQDRAQESIQYFEEDKNGPEDKISYKNNILTQRYTKNNSALSSALILDDICNQIKTIYDENVFNL